MSGWPKQTLLLTAHNVAAGDFNFVYGAPRLSAVVGSFVLAAGALLMLLPVAVVAVALVDSVDSVVAVAASGIGRTASVSVVARSTVRAGRTAGTGAATA